MIIVSRQQEVEFSFASDKTAKPSVLRFRSLPRREALRYGVLVSGLAKGLSEELINLICDYVKTSLVGWRHVVSEDGKEIPFNEEDREANLEILTFDRMIEVVRCLNTLNKVGGDKAKNSESP